MKNLIVVKIGTASLSRPEGGLNLERIRALAEELARLSKKGFPPILVSSGAIGAGMDKFGWTTRPTAIADKQAAAAVGQVALMRAYEDAFGASGVTVGQMLLSRADLEDRARYLNARHTLLALAARGVVPVINENDTVATEEIQFGDNDALAALVAAKMEAQKLFLLTDVDGLLVGKGADAQVLPEVFQITKETEALIQKGKGSEKSAGGMASKINAARLAMASGVEVWIASGKKAGVIESLLEGRGVGTRFAAAEKNLNHRQRWIAFGKRIRGTITVDAGAVKALLENKRSLLPSGIAEVEGEFAPGDTVRVRDAGGREIARGLAAFSSQDMEKIKGKKSADIEKALGRAASPEAIHRDNLAVLP